MQSDYQSQGYSPPQPSVKRNGCLYLFSKALGRLLQIIGAMTLLMVGSIFGLALLGAAFDWLGGWEPGSGPQVLELDLRSPLEELPSGGGFGSGFGGDDMSLRDAVEALEMARSDDSIAGLFLEIEANSGGLANAQELREAISAFRAEGKFAIAFSESFGEYGPGNGGYYLASACDEIHVQPSGSVGLTGLAYETMFFGGAFEKFGIKAEFDKRSEYKNAVNSYTETSYTPAHREALQALMDDQFSQLIRGIAEARELDEEEVHEIFDRGPFVAAKALDEGLIDALSYRDEALARAFALAEVRLDSAEPDAEIAADQDADSNTDPDLDLDTDADTESQSDPDASGDPEASTESEEDPFADDLGPATYALEDYLADVGRPNTEGDVVALIYAVGNIMRGESVDDPLFGSRVLGAASLSAAIEQAAADDEVTAIILRIDSPGGSYVASDTIRRAIIRAKDAGKPIIASMGSVAGSGGYFIAMDADHIVAQPGSITGSIGVYAGKFVTRDAFSDTLGIQFDSIQTSKHSRMYSSNIPFTPEDKAKHSEWLDTIYEDFTSKVAEGRGLTRAQVEAIARGRIWSGEDALANGLVDSLGGFPETLAQARIAAGLDPDAALKIRVFSAELSWWEQWLGSSIGLETKSKKPGRWSLITDIAGGSKELQELRPALKVLDDLQAKDPGSIDLLMPDLPDVP